MDDDELDELLRAVGRRLRHARLQANLSQEALASKSGVHRLYIGAIERGERNPTLRVLCELTNAIGVEFPVLFADPD